MTSSITQNNIQAEAAITHRSHLNNMFLTAKIILTLILIAFLLGIGYWLLTKCD